MLGLDKSEFFSFGTLRYYVIGSNFNIVSLSIIVNNVYQVEFPLKVRALKARPNC